MAVVALVAVSAVLVVTTVGMIGGITGMMYLSLFVVLVATLLLLRELFQGVKFTLELTHFVRNFL